MRIVGRIEAPTSKAIEKPRAEVPEAVDAKEEEAKKKPVKKTAKK